MKEKAMFGLVLGNSNGDRVNCSTDIHDHKMLERRLKQSNEAARAAEAEHKKRAEDALETRRQQEFFIVVTHHVDLTIGYGISRTSKPIECDCSKLRRGVEFSKRITRTANHLICDVT